ncbi:selenocysteine-specific translation elongation factor [Sulfidibacter corallicola]|uniref:Selenocysteine-specific elongation factor n=1 Tax=Sulfidibacter corallicola TaxID=2818388 RepID=A0A8A4TU29_SULCO|nr:selenocysteine-specific translation elongation factor [Sulfidibacter corallicola]QTD52973.1 selenocysteine-specific translation elongation factor [Sulfidibacter corallicola]
MTASVLIATAGHVDHGKSSLVQTLTGIDPDRWAEEKNRGITIDLGYAHLNHAGRTYSFVDVPGHEKFIHNMLSGIGSIDAVLLVIAADESIMPQTEEHATALHYLGVTQVHVIISKVDLVDAEMLSLLHLELDEWLARFGWEKARRVPFSTRQPETRSSVCELLTELTERRAESRGPARLSIDRVFAATGSGTVVTGTVERGSLKRETWVLLEPDDRKARIRQIQIHGSETHEAGPHTRAALNLTGIHYKSIKRGHLVFSDCAPPSSRRIWVRLTRFDPDWAPSPKHHFHLHHLAAHLKGRLLWCEGDWAALETREPYPFWALDRGLIRDGSPLQLVAGFEVIHPNPASLKRRKAVAWLSALPQPLDLHSWQQAYLESYRDPISLNEITAIGGMPPTLAEGVVLIGEDLVISAVAARQALDRLIAAVTSGHQAAPYKPWLPVPEIKAGLPTHTHAEIMWRYTLERAITDEVLEISTNRLRRKDYRPIWKPRDLELLRRFMTPFDRQGGWLDAREWGPERKGLAAMEQWLTSERCFINLSPDLLVHFKRLNAIAAHLVASHGREGFSIQDLKTELGLSRKHAIPLLEWLDHAKITRREGDRRHLVSREIEPLVCDLTLPEPFADL